MEKGGKEGKEISMYSVLSNNPTGDLAHNPGICPNWEWNQQPFGLHLVLNPLSHTSQASWYF